MSRYTPAARPLVQCLRGSSAVSILPFRPASVSLPRSFSSTPDRPQDTAATPSGGQPQPPLEGWELDPHQTTLPWAEKELMQRGTPPVGSRRRRAALRAATALAASQSLPGGAPLPFELMPYQCFQEARKVLQADREEKLRQIAVESAKIRKLESVVVDPAQEGGRVGLPNTSRGGEPYRQRRLASLRKHVEKLKILADINDPLVKRRFEDGLGDMSKPIYRYLAELRWRDRPLRLIQQRIQQFHLTPDLLPPRQLLSPRADVDLFFRSYRVAPGAIVDSLISEVCPRLRVQVFDRGPRLVTVLIVDADVPDWDNATYANRCHFLAANIPLDPTDTSLPLSRLDPHSQLVLPWLPAFAQKGSPPHRLAILVLEQKKLKSSSSSSSSSSASSSSSIASALAPPPSVVLDTAAIQASLANGRDNFSVRDFVYKNKLEAVGCTLFRTQWDAGTEGVMQRAGVPGADVELKPIRFRSLKSPRKARGWEAKRQGPKYRHLWKYTHRIATPKRKFVR